MFKCGDCFFDDRNGRFLTIDGTGSAYNIYSCIEEEENENGNLEITNRVLLTSGELAKMQKIER